MEEKEETNRFPCKEIIIPKIMEIEDPTKFHKPVYPKFAPCIKCRDNQRIVESGYCSLCKPR